MDLPALTTQRLVIRPLVMEDLDAVEKIQGEPEATRSERQRWLQWTTLSYGELARLHQPPYGDRGIALRTTGVLVGLCGFVPLLDVYGQLPALRSTSSMGLASTEFGLYWAVASAHRRHGYASEGARALIDYAFGRLRLERIIATTDHENVASIGVMQKLGMRIERNPFPEPPWLQVVGLLWHPSLRAVPV